MFSVVIPMYNSSKSIIKCLESVINQTRRNLIDEVIVINDGSMDDSLEKVKNWLNDSHKSIPVNIIDIENSGVSSARNIGIEYANSEWIAFLDSDDVWKPNKIELQYNVIKQFPEILFLGGNRDYEQHRYGCKYFDNLYRLSALQMLIKPWPHTSTIIARKYVLEEFGCFDISRSYCEDIQLWMKVAHKYGVYYMYESLEYFGDGKPSFGHSGLSANLKKMHKGMNDNLREAHKLGYINFFTFISLLVWEFLKYIRRIALTWIRKRG